MPDKVRFCRKWNRGLWQEMLQRLGYENPSRDVQRHCKKVNKITQTTDSVVPPLTVLIIPESDVYRLVMRSNLPAAIEFQDWICEEVIPSIRRTGGYMLDKPDDTCRGWWTYGRKVNGMVNTVDRKKGEVLTS